MTTAAFYPYRSEAAREYCFAYLNTLAARQWPVPSEERVVPTAFGPTFVRVSGPPGAPPLVLLHGAATTSLMWAPNIEALSTCCRTFAVDQIGEFGRSLCTRPIRSLEDLLAWLHELIDSLHPAGTVSLAGLSFGGGLAAQFALHFPAKLNKVVLLAPANTALRLGIAFWTRLMLAAVSSRTFLPSFVRWMFADMARKDPAWIDATIELLSTNMGNLQPHRPPIPPVLNDGEWRSLQVPALFLVGAHEVIYSATQAVRRLNRVAPQVKTEIVPEAGHDLTFVQADLVNQRILDFLTQPVGADTAVAAAPHASR